MGTRPNGIGAQTFTTTGGDSEPETNNWGIKPSEKKVANKLKELMGETWSFFCFLKGFIGHREDLVEFNLLDGF